MTILTFFTFISKGVWCNVLSGITNFIKSGLVADVYKYCKKYIKHFDHILCEKSRCKIIL